MDLMRSIIDGVLPEEFMSSARLSSRPRFPAVALSANPGSVPCVGARARHISRRSDESWGLVRLCGERPPRQFR